MISTIYIGLLIFAGTLQGHQNSDTTRAVIESESYVFQTNSETEKRSYKKFSIEVSGGMGIGEYTGAYSGLEFSPDMNWRVKLNYRPLSWLSVYSGYGQTSFDCTHGFCRGYDITFTGAGMDAGIQLHASWFWMGAGLLKHNLTAASSQSFVSDESKWGYDLRAGLLIPVTSLFEISIGGRYAMYDTRFADDEVFNSVNYITTEIGLRINIF